jgi:hypothetical protein
MNFSQNFEQSSWANSVCADEVSASDYKRLLSLLEAIYAEAVSCEVGKLAKESCCGCEYDHPSQRRHDCLMLSEQEKWQSYGLEAIERVIVKRMVWREFVEAIRVMKLQYHKDAREHFDNLEKSPDSTFVYSLMDLHENSEDSEFESILNYLSYWREDKRV